MNRTKTFVLATALAVSAMLAYPRTSRASGLPHCEAMSISVSVPGVPNAFMYGELCMPQGAAPDTVQVLVHSTWYNLRSWDPPQQPYSYVRAASDRGYATFNLDRFGTGRSSKPAANLVTIDVVESTIHQIIVGLRSGAIGGHAFSKVVWVGASFGSAYGWVNGSNHPGDADAYVLTGILHITKPSFMGLVLPIATSACDDPALRHLNLDCNYITNRPGTKGIIYYNVDTAAPGMIPNGVDDAVMRDVVSVFLLAESVARLGGILDFFQPAFTYMPVDTDYARGIHVPTLLVVGDKDKIFCGPPDGIRCLLDGTTDCPAACTEEDIRIWESPYFTVTPDIYVAPETGHEVAVHLSAPTTYLRMLDWVDAHVGGHN